LSNIIRQVQGGMEDIRRFALPGDTTDPNKQEVRLHALSNIIRSREAAKYPVRAVTWDEAPLEPTQDARHLPSARPHRPQMQGDKPALTPSVESTDASDAAQELLPAPLADHVLLLRQAQEEAACCLQAAHAQATAITAEAYSVGFKQGEEAAREAMREPLALALASFQHAAEAILHLRAQVLRLAEDDVITLAFHFARKVIQQEALHNREVLSTTLRCALDCLIDCDNIVVRVSPADLQHALELQADLLNICGGIKALAIQADAAIGRGGCVVDSTFGEIDARLEAQIEEIEQRFREQYSPVTEALTA
jgi:flagellar biosynthesis/type III secretory pathway protein FliH